ncbi:DUF6233 domain-containing protein [Streptomyces griseofuscus]|uniref:DUF6233 domain-containing protein n=1 Tax=Streptomyces griseofuscus TaxID=146922 RepID=UPI0036CB9EC4
MNEFSPVERLAKLHALEEWLAWQLESTRRKIHDLEAQAVEYVVEPPIHLNHPAGATVHVAGCTTIRRETRPMSVKDARFALEKDPIFHGCEDCDPGAALGLET